MATRHATSRRSTWGSDPVASFSRWAEDSGGREHCRVERSIELEEATDRGEAGVISVSADDVDAGLLPPVQLADVLALGRAEGSPLAAVAGADVGGAGLSKTACEGEDRKSTRLNS